MSGREVALSELERDALTELVNIGVSRAAASLRNMVGNQVMLTVPSIELVSRKAAATLIQERESGVLIAVLQDFEGEFSGRALLIFPETNGLALVRAVTGDAVPPEEVPAMETEALLETGNVVLNGCLGTMANLLKRPLTLSLPHIIRGDGELFFELAERANDNGVVLFLYINFLISGHDVQGYIAMLMDMPSLESLKFLIGEFIERVIGADDVGQLG
jgi:chemotaxis protein CheC